MQATRLFGLVDTDESGMVSLPEITSFLYTSPDFDHRQGHLLVNACRRHSSISKEEVRQPPSFFYVSTCTYESRDPLR